MSAEHDDGHSHGLVHDSIKRSREGVRAVSVALAVLGVTAAAQAVVFAVSGSVALLADLIHNAGDALTAARRSRGRVTEHKEGLTPFMFRDCGRSRA